MNSEIDWNNINRTLLMPITQQKQQQQCNVQGKLINGLENDACIRTWSLDCWKAKIPRNNISNIKCDNTSKFWKNLYKSCDFRLRFDFHCYINHNKLLLLISKSDNTKSPTLWRFGTTCLLVSTKIVRNRQNCHEYNWEIVYIVSSRY